MSKNTTNNNINGKVQFPTSIGTLILVMTKLGWDFIKEKTKEGKPTKSAILYTCPNCNDYWIKAGKTPVLAKRAAKHVVVFEKGERKVAVCAVCGWRKHNGTESGPATTPSGPLCGCGNQLPAGRKKFCYSCRPQEGQPIAQVTSM